MEHITKEDVEIAAGIYHKAMKDLDYLNRLGVGGEHKKKLGHSVIQAVIATREASICLKVAYDEWAAFIEDYTRGRIS